MAQPVVFLHGWTMRGAIFDDVIARLGPDFDCAAPDLPGHGSAADAPATLAACADSVDEVLARWPNRNVIIVGWSMGAAAAWSFLARRGSERIGGLATVDMSPRITPDADWPHGLKGQTAESVAMSTNRFAEDWESATHRIAATMFAKSDGAPDFTRQAARDLIVRQDPQKMRALWDQLVAMDLRGAIPGITVPYLVCSGAESKVYPASASDWIVRNAPHARAQVFEHSGHSPHLEEPAAFARVIAGFAAEVGG